MEPKLTLHVVGLKLGLRQPTPTYSPTQQIQVLVELATAFEAVSAAIHSLQERVARLEDRCGDGK